MVLEFVATSSYRSFKLYLHRKQSSRNIAIHVGLGRLEKCIDFNCSSEGRGLGL